MTRYKFKGYTITNCGYHQPDHCVWWEAVDENGEACFHGNTLREVEFMILNYEWEQKMRKKDEEIEKLKREKIEVEADALAVGGIVEAARTAEKSSAVGNAAAMREALVAMVEAETECSMDRDDLCGRCLEKMWDSCKHDGSCWVDKVINALSAPARNCDFYSNAREALKAHEEAFNESNFHHGECKLGCPDCDDYAIRCEIKWLFAPAAERKGERDGK